MWLNLVTRPAAAATIHICAKGQQEKALLPYPPKHFFVYIFGELECVGHSFASVPFCIFWELS
jgi:hypothetical protein